MFPRTVAMLGSDTSMLGSCQGSDEKQVGMDRQLLKLDQSYQTTLPTWTHTSTHVSECFFGSNRWLLYHCSKRKTARPVNHRSRNAALATHAWAFGVDRLVIATESFQAKVAGDEDDKVANTRTTTDFTLEHLAFQESFVRTAFWRSSQHIDKSIFDFGLK